MHCQPLSYYVSLHEKSLRFHILDVGQGLMILVIFPDSTTMLYDCNVTNEKEEEIINYLIKNIPTRKNERGQEEQWIDIFVNSHRDIDHYRGLQKINRKFTIKSIWDSGQSGATTQDDDYNYYMYLRRKVKSEYGDNALYIPRLSLTPKNFGGASVFCLSSSLDFVNESMILTEAKIQHTNAIVLNIQYSGQALLLASDSDWLSWKENIIPIFKNSGILQSTILVASHHGSRSFFTDEANSTIDLKLNPSNTYIESIDYINPKITLISCGNYEIYHHPNEHALAIYNEKTFNSQVYITRNTKTLCGYINSVGNWTVCPSRFSIESNPQTSFQIKCTATDKQGNSRLVPSGASLSVGYNLKYTLSSNIGLFDPYTYVDTCWEVSNGGESSDQNHQEIYQKGDSETGGIFSFTRDLTYRGRHLLRCTVINRKKNLSATQIFMVNGI